VGKFAVPVPVDRFDWTTFEKRVAFAGVVLRFSGGYECFLVSARTMVKVEIEEDKPSVTIQSMDPRILKDKKEKELLEEDLREIGCLGFIKRPWKLRDKSEVRKLIEGQPSEFSLTARAKPDDWSPGMWRTVYAFPKGGKGFASRSDKLCHDGFSGFVHSKDGYAVSDCENPR